MKFSQQQLNLYLSPSEFTKVKEVTNEIDISQTGSSQIKYYDVWLSNWHRIEPSTYFDRVPQINQNNRIYYAPSGFYVGIAFRYWLIRICEAYVDSDGNVTYTWKFTECNRSDKKKILDELMGGQPIVSVNYNSGNITARRKYGDAYLMNSVDPSVDIGEIPAFCLPNGYAKTDFASGVFTPVEYFESDKGLDNVPIIGDIYVYNFNNFDYGSSSNEPCITSNVFTGDTVEQTVFSVIPLYGVSLQLYMPMVTGIDLLETDTASYNQLFDRTLIALYSNYRNTHTGSGSPDNSEVDSGEFMLGGTYEIVIYPILAPNQTASGGDTSGQQDNNTI